MKHYLYSAFLAAALLCPPAFAQSFVTGANIPFAFKVGDTSMPAGKYRLSEKDGVLTVSPAQGKGTIFRLTQPAYKSATPAENRVRFTRYGGECYLTSFWNGHTNQGRAIVLSKHERELAAHYRTYETADIVMQPPPR